MTAISAGGARHRDLVAQPGGWWAILIGAVLLGIGGVGADFTCGRIGGRIGARIGPPTPKTAPEPASRIGPGNSPGPPKAGPYNDRVQPVLTPEQMGASDRATIAAGTPSLELMERAGRAVARAAVRLAGGAYGRRFLVICGRGNNAGDGYVAARLLAAWGAFPVVVALSPADELSGDARTNWEALGRIRCLPYEPGRFARELDAAHVVVDALFGTGFRGSLSGAAAQVVEAVNRRGRPVVAVDIPSGVDGATGEIQGPAIRATTTVAMAARKLGLVLYPGSAAAGVIEVADIGIAVPEPPAVAGMPEAGDVAAALGPRPLDAHKRSVGTVLLVAGSRGMAGAAALATKAALRSGAGLAALATVASVAAAQDLGVLEATTLALPETPEGTVGAGSVELVAARAEGVSAVAIGPGLTTAPRTVEVVRALAQKLERPLVLDADGLNAIAGDANLLAARSAPTVVTPHPGELARLLQTTTAAIQADRLGSATKAARLLNAAVVLKGYRSIVASPEGELAVVTTGGPALATGGTGDVLTGVTVAFLAAGLAPFAAAWAAAWVHGRAGDVLAGRIGVRGTLAGDLPGAVAGVLHDLEEVW